VDESKKPYFSSMAELQEAWCFKGAEEVVFLFFLFGLFFCFASYWGGI
jgi:hypothetical protein